ncbi:MAG: translation initiation factor IF-2, partial [uncultured bacterium]
MRIYELAKELDCNSNDIKDILDELKITYKTHSSSIPDEMVSVVKEKFLNKGSSVKVDKVENIEIEKAEKATKEKAPAKSKKIAKVESKSEDKKTEKKDSKPVIDEILPVSADEDIKDLTSTYVPWIEEEEEKDFEREVKRKKFKKHVDKDFSEKPEKNIKDLFIDKHEKDEKEEPAIIKEKPAVKPKVFDGMTLKELSECISISSSELIKKLFMMGVMASINKSLDIDTILIIADELKIEVEVEEIEKLEEIEEEKVQEVEKVIQEEELAVPEEYLEIRPPVVTIMGHVNHGKTTLLDSIRKSKIVDTESGGITQHIGAYIVEHKKSKICFIDTPGHAAFTNMRAMGANVTDIVVLIVAANDGIQPQTLESINHAKEAAVPIIVAINKIDIDGIGVDKIKADLSQHGLTPEDWGGECLCVPISAIKGQGIEELLDAINLQAELLELKANPKGKAFGIVLESCQTDQQGPLVTVLVKNGVFKVGDPILCAHVYGKIKRMENDKNEIVEVATPSMPVRIFG